MIPSIILKKLTSHTTFLNGCCWDIFHPITKMYGRNFPRPNISTSPSSKPIGLFASQGHCEIFNWSDSVWMEGTFMALKRDRSRWSWNLISSFLADSRLSRSQFTWENTGWSQLLGSEGYACITRPLPPPGPSIVTDP